MPKEIKTEAQELTEDLANPEWLGECGWCGEEVNIFAHSVCPNFPTEPNTTGR